LIESEALVDGALVVETNQQIKDQKSSTIQRSKITNHHCSIDPDKEFSKSSGSSSDL
jgi:hypothetical protein